MFNGNEPLGLPRGSVRAVITLGIIGVTLGMFTMGAAVPDLLGGAFLAALGYYGLTRLTNGG